MTGMICGTKPRHVFDRILWPTLKKSWERASRKNSHWWHWRRFRGQVTDVLYIRGDKDATHNVFLGTNFLWQEVVVLAPVPDQSHCDYMIGFRDGKNVQICSIVVHGQVAVLLGPRAVDFFAVTRYGQAITLRQVKMTSRKKLRPGVPLL